MKSSESHADITPGHTGTHAGYSRRAHLRVKAVPSQTLLKIKRKDTSNLNSILFYL